MRKLLFIVLPILFVVSLLLLTPLKQKVENIFTVKEVKAAITDGLVGYWNFNEGAGTTAGDSSSSGNTGTLTNGPTWTTGKIGQALSFDGVNDYVNAGNVLAGLPAFTLSAWFNASTFQSTNYGMILSKHSGGSNGEWFLSVKATGFSFIHLNTIPTRTDFNVAKTIATNTWYHIVAVYSGSTMELFLNGISIGSTAKSGGTQTTTNQLYVGWYSGQGATWQFNGLIDDVRIYNRTLSVDEIQRLYNLGR